MTSETDDEIARTGEYDSTSENGIDNLPVLAVPINSLRPGFFLRQSGTDASHVQLLAEAASADDLPAILVQKSSLRVVDGMHRIEVAKLRGQQTINARFVDCTDQEAFILAVRSNTLHGLPLSRADRISGAKRILDWHRDWSNRAVAAATGLSAKTIALLRDLSADEEEEGVKRLGRDGKRRPVTGGEGRKRAAAYLAAHPDASLREVSRETDVSIGTVHDIRARIRRGEDPTAVGSRRPQGKPAQAEHGPWPVHAGDGAGSPVHGASSIANGRALHAHGVSLLANGAYRPANGTNGTNGANGANGAGANGSGRSVNGVSLLANGAHPGNGGYLPANGADLRGRRRNGLAPAWPSIANKLSGDPAIKYSECGREFLRWMAIHAISLNEWEKFIGAVPAHWAEGVSLVAQGVSEAWREFADQLRAAQADKPEQIPIRRRQPVRSMAEESEV